MPRAEPSVNMDYNEAKAIEDIERNLDVKLSGGLINFSDVYKMCYDYRNGVRNGMVSLKKMVQKKVNEFFDKNFSKEKLIEDDQIGSEKYIAIVSDMCSRYVKIYKDLPKIFRIDDSNASTINIVSDAMRKVLLDGFAEGIQKRFLDVYDMLREEDYSQKKKEFEAKEAGEDANNTKSSTNDHRRKEMRNVYSLINQFSDISHFKSNEFSNEMTRRSKLYFESCFKDLYDNYRTDGRYTEYVKGFFDAEVRILFDIFLYEDGLSGFSIDMVYSNFLSSSSTGVANEILRLFANEMLFGKMFNETLDTVFGPEASQFDDKARKQKSFSEDVRNFLCKKAESEGLDLQVNFLLLRDIIRVNFMSKPENMKWLAFMFCCAYRGLERANTGNSKLSSTAEYFRRAVACAFIDEVTQTCAESVLRNATKGLASKKAKAAKRRAPGSSKGGEQNDQEAEGATEEGKTKKSVKAKRKDDEGQAAEEGAEKVKKLARGKTGAKAGLKPRVRTQKKDSQSVALRTFLEVDAVYSSQAAFEEFDRMLKRYQTDDLLKHILSGIVKGTGIQSKRASFIKVDDMVLLVDYLMMSITDSNFDIFRNSPPAIVGKFCEDFNVKDKSGCVEASHYIFKLASQLDPKLHIGFVQRSLSRLLRTKDLDNESRLISRLDNSSSLKDFYTSMQLNRSKVTNLKESDFQKFPTITEEDISSSLDKMNIVIVDDKKASGNSCLDVSESYIHFDIYKPLFNSYGHKKNGVFVSQSPLWSVERVVVDRVKTNSGLLALGKFTSFTYRISVVSEDDGSLSFINVVSDFSHLTILNYIHTMLYEEVLIDDRLVTRIKPGVGLQLLSILTGLSKYFDQDVTCRVLYNLKVNDIIHMPGLDSAKVDRSSSESIICYGIKKPTRDDTTIYIPTLDSTDAARAYSAHVTSFVKDQANILTKKKGGVEKDQLERLLFQKAKKSLQITDIKQIKEELQKLIIESNDENKSGSRILKKIVKDGKTYLQNCNYSG